MTVTTPLMLAVLGPEILRAAAQAELLVDEVMEPYCVQVEPQTLTPTQAGLRSHIAMQLCRLTEAATWRLYEL